MTNTCEVRVPGRVRLKVRARVKVRVRVRGRVTVRGRGSLEVRAPGPAVAKTSVPRSLDTLTGSSLMFALRYLALSAGSPARPNWQMNLGTTRKKRAWLG